jgi:hypothetical protein
MHTGRCKQARRHALAARDAGLPELSSRLPLVIYGALAMTADDEKEAAEMYTRAETHPARVNFPFELARIHLAHGIRLRHTHGPKAARRPLVRAADVPTARRRVLDRAGPGRTAPLGGVRTHHIVEPALADLAGAPPAA